MEHHFSRTAAQLDNILSAPVGKGRRVAIIGTSLVGNCHTGHSNGDIKSYSSRGWMPWAEAYAQDAFICPVWPDPNIIPGWEPAGDVSRYYQGLNFGVTGQTLEQIKARVPYIIENYINKFDIIVIDGGTNDAGSLSKEEIHAGRVWLCEQFLAYGKTVVLLPILSRSTSVWASGSAYRKKVNWVNSKTRDYANKSNIYIFDWNKYFVDYSTVDGIPFTTHAGDGTHFDSYGAEAVGEALAAFLLNLLPAQMYPANSPDDKYDAVYNPYGSILPFGPAFLDGEAGANGTASSGSVLTGARIERSSGASCSVLNSLPTAEDGRGKKQVMTFTLGGTADELFLFRTSSLDIAHGLAGKWVQGFIEVDTNNSDAIVRISPIIEDRGSNTLVSKGFETYAYTEKSSIVTPYPAKNRVGLLFKTPPLLIESDSTNIRFRVEVMVRGSGSVAPVVKFRNAILRQIDDPRV